MRTLLLLFLLFIYLVPVYAQNFSLSELIKINSLEVDEFDTYVTKKGYVYYETLSSFISDGTSYCYYEKGEKKAYITKFKYKPETKEMVSFQTPSSSIYLKIKSELKMLGFRFVDKNVHEGTTFFNYKKGYLEVALASSVQTSNYVDKLTSYEISVSKIY